MYTHAVSSICGTWICTVRILLAFSGNFMELYMFNVNKYCKITWYSYHFKILTPGLGPWITNWVSMHCVGNIDAGLHQLNLVRLQHLFYLHIYQAERPYACVVGIRLLTLHLLLKSFHSYLTVLILPYSIDFLVVLQSPCVQGIHLVIAFIPLHVLYIAPLPLVIYLNSILDCLDVPRWLLSVYVLPVFTFTV